MNALKQTASNRTPYIAVFVFIQSTSLQQSEKLQRSSSRMGYGHSVIKQAWLGMASF
jgi:hypothetical protein